VARSVGRWKCGLANLKSFNLLQAVFLPGVFALLFLLNWQRAISLASTRDLSPGWTTIISSVGAGTVAVVNFVRERSRSQTHAREQKRIISGQKPPMRTTCPYIRRG